MRSTLIALALLVAVLMPSAASAESIDYIIIGPAGLVDCSFNQVAGPFEIAPSPAVA